MKKASLFLFLFYISLLSFSQKKTLIIDENFVNNKNNWSTSEESNRNSIIDSSKNTYNLSVKADNPKALIPRINHVNLNKLNFTIEAKLMHTSGVENYNYGLRFGEDDNYAMNFYITANGHFRVTEYYKSKWHEKIKFTKTTALKPSGKYNTIKVTRNAQLLQFYINNELVYTCFEKIYFGHQSGFYLPSERDIAIKVDYIKIWTAPLIIPTIENPLEDVKFENLGPGINSKWSEKASIISADGKTLYYIRDEKLEGIEKTKDQVYSSTINDDGTWSAAKKAPFPVNIRENTGVISISPDQNQISLYSTRDEEGQYLNSKGFCTSRKIENGQWSIPENLEINEYENTSKYREYCLSSTGQVLFMAIENSESYGNRDIYVSFLKNGRWSKPKNLGALVNTFAKEMTPFLAADDKTLYFSSKGHLGYGQNDVFVCKRLDDTWLNWSKPLNLGKGINGTGGETFFTVMASGEYGFLSKWDNSIDYGEDDIYRIKLPASARPDPLVLVKGKVLNKKTNEPISAEIKYVELGTEKIIGTALSAPETGAYQVSLPAGKKYAYYAEKEGFYAVEDNLDLENLSEFKTLEQNLYLVPIEKGEVIRLNNIFFETGKAALLPASYSELDKLLAVLVNNPNLIIKIKGHTDNVGSDTSNKTLSQERAKAVYNYLIGKKINENRLSFEGYGESNPIKKNETEEGRKTNRRVEFEVL